LTSAEGPPEIYLRIDGPPLKLSLSASQSTAPAALQLLLTGADAMAPQKAKLSVVKPDDRRLSVTEPQPAVVTVSPDPPTATSLTVTWSDDAVRNVASPPSGFVVRARLEDQRPSRTYHALVPVAIVAADMVPRLALSSDAARADDLPMDQLRLRPIAGERQPFFVSVRNPSSKPAKVIIEVWVGDTLAAWAGVPEKPLEVPAGATFPVPGFTTPPPKPGEPPSKPDGPLPELAAPLRLRLRDTAGTVLGESPIQVAIATPQDYIAVTAAQFVPEAPGQHNRLTVSLRALPQMIGPPCQVELVLPQDKKLFPILLAPPKEGKLKGTVEVGKPPVTLFAEKLALGQGNDLEGSFYVHVDSVKRALWFRSRFPEFGGPQRVSEPQTPRVRFHPSLQVEPGKPARLLVEFEVDHAPPGTRLEFRLGRVEGGRFKDDLTPWTDTPKRRHLGFDPKGEGGALLFEASLEDWVRELPVSGLLGRRTLWARLLDSRHNEPDSFKTDVVLDDQKPQEIAIGVPERIEKGTVSLPVSATVKPPASGIKEVAFIFGPEAEFEKAVTAGQAVVKRQPNDAEGRSWTATLPVPKDAAAGKLVVTARFRTGVGLTAFKSEEVTIFERPKDADKPAKKEELKPGAIVGTVTEGDRPQAGLKVYLIERGDPANQKPTVLSQDTDAKGAFAFKDLDPKKQYQLYCVKQDGINNRTVSKQVMVESGQTLKVALELTR
jgi:hypothetical protein